MPWDGATPLMAIDDSVVYGKSARGAIRLASPHDDELPPRERQLLILLDGQRTIGELSELLGAQTARSLIARLETKGFAQRIGQAPGTAGDAAHSHTGTPGSDGEPSARRTRWYRDWFALVNLAMTALVLAIAAWLLLIDERQSDVASPGGMRAGTLDTRHAAGSADESEANGDPGRVVTVAPLSHLPALSGAKSA